MGQFSNFAQPPSRMFLSLWTADIGKVKVLPGLPAEKTVNNQTSSTSPRFEVLSECVQEYWCVLWLENWFYSQLVPRRYQMMKLRRRGRWSRGGCQLEGTWTETCFCCRRNSIDILSENSISLKFQIIIEKMDRNTASVLWENNGRALV